MKRKIHRTYLVLILSFALIIGHLGSVLQDKHILTVGSQQSTRTVVLATARGTVYDRHMQPLNNTESRCYGVLVPELKQLNRLKSDMSEAEYQRLKKELKEQHLLVANLTKISYVGPKIYTYQAPIRYDNQEIITPLLGAVDESRIISQYTGKISVTYPVNGVGDCPSDGTLKATNTLSKSKGGIQLTIDKTTQQKLNSFVENRLSEGAAFILDAKTAELFAYSASSTTENTASLQLASHLDCDLIKKIVIAAGALESGLTAEQTLLCTGQLTFGGTTYTCSNPLGHHLLNMQDAFTQNCSLFFLQLAQQMGDDTLYKTAKSLGLYDTVSLAEGIVADGDFAEPHSTFIESNLTITPLHLAQLAATCANGGTMNSPTVVLGTVNENKEQTTQKQGRGVTALSEKSAQTLKDILKPCFYDKSGDTQIYVGMTAQYVVTIVSKDQPLNQDAMQNLYHEIINFMH